MINKFWCQSFKSDTDFDFKISISLVFPIFCKQLSAKKMGRRGKDLTIRKIL
jgi:hypothetical protein